jgi:predicted Zn-dependent protease
VSATAAPRARATSDERPDRATAALRDDLEAPTAESQIPPAPPRSEPAIPIPSIETPAVRSLRSEPALPIPAVEASARRAAARPVSDSGVRVPPPPRSEAALSDAPRLAPKGPPSPPPMPRARPAAADLLEIPFDPAEFADMPPAPAAPVTHEAPADLDRLPGPDPSGVRPGAPPKAPPRRPGEPSEAPAKPARAHRPAAPADAPAKPARAHRPAEPSEAPAKPARAHRPAAPPEPPPARKAEPSAPREPSPDYSTEYASYFDARDSEVKEITDELGALVEERVSLQPQRPAAPPTMPAPLVVGRRGVRGAVRLAFLAVGVVVLLVAVSSIWRYRGAASEADRLLTDTREALADGNYASRLTASERLGETLDVDPFARLGDMAARAAGQGGLAGRHRALASLQARVEAERAALFGEPARLEAAKSALDRAGDGEAAADAAIAAALLALREGRLADAEARLAVAVGEQGADVLYVQALIAQADGRREAAVDRARTAADRDPRHVGARKLLADLKGARGDYLGALEGYDQILESLRPDHVDTRIARARLQILIPKREQEAVTHLKELLDPDAWKVSDAQKALIHDGIGLFYSNQGDFRSARTAYAAALQAAPDDPRFSTGLARLDIREFKLDEAEERLTRAAALDRGVERHHVDLARVRLLRGDAKGALAHLEKVRQPDADALLLRGRALLATDDARAAEEALNEALRLDAGLLDARIYLSLAAFVQGRRGLALGQLQAHRSSQAGGDQRLEDRTLPFRAYGDALARDGDARAAAGEYQRAVDVSQGDFLAHFGLCRLDAERLEARDALKRCRDALGVNPHYLPAAELLSTVAEAQEDAGAVAAALEPILRKRPEPPALVRRLARAYVALGRADDAMALAEGEAAAADDSTKRYIRGLVAAHRGSIGEALPLLNGVADELGDDAWAQLAHADALMKAGKSDQAGGFYRRALKVGAGARAALGAAQAWLLQGEWKDALTSAEEAERLAKQGLAHRRLRAEALASQARAWLQSGGGGAARAASLLDRAQRIEVDLPATLVALGQLAEVEGRTADAVAHYTRATTVSPDDPEGFYWLGRMLRDTSGGRDGGATALRRAAQLDPEGRWGLRARRLLDRR